MCRVDDKELEGYAKFKIYLALKCSNPDFKEQYDRRCNLYSNTVAIISRMRENGISADEPSRRTGVDWEYLLKLKSTDWCRSMTLENSAWNSISKSLETA
jgi:hypothetical protein